MRTWLSGILLSLVLVALAVVHGKPPKPATTDEDIVKVRVCETVYCPMVQRGEIPLWLAQAYGCNCEGQSDGAGTACAPRPNWLGLTRTHTLAVIR